LDTTLNFYAGVITGIFGISHFRVWITTVCVWITNQIARF